MAETSTYRLDRGPALLVSGTAVVVAAVALFAGIVLAGRSGVIAGIGVASFAVAAIVLVLAVLIPLRPPVVVRLDAEGIRSRGVSVRWLDVDSVSFVADVLVLEGESLQRQGVRLAEVGRRRAELIIEVYERLNTAHGYRRFDPATDA